MSPTATSKQPRAPHARGAGPGRFFNALADQVPLLFRLPDVSSPPPGEQEAPAGQSSDVTAYAKPEASNATKISYHPAHQAAPHWETFDSHGVDSSAGSASLATDDGTASPAPSPPSWNHDAQAANVSAEPLGWGVPTPHLASSNSAPPHEWSTTTDAGSPSQAAEAPQDVSTLAAGYSWWDHWSSGVVIILMVILLVTLLIVSLTRSPEPEPSLLAEFGVDAEGLEPLTAPSIEPTGPDPAEPSSANAAIGADLPPGDGHKMGAPPAGDLRNPHLDAELVDGSTSPQLPEPPQTSGLIVEAPPSERTPSTSFGNQSSPAPTNKSNQQHPSIGAVSAGNAAAITANSAVPANESPELMLESGARSADDTTAVPHHATANLPPATGEQDASIPGQGVDKAESLVIAVGSPPAKQTDAVRSPQAPAEGDTEMPSLDSLLGLIPEQPQEDPVGGNGRPSSSSPHRPAPSSASPSTGSTAGVSHSPAIGESSPAIRSTATPEDDTEALLRAYQEFRKAQLRAEKINRYQQTAQ
ncbi:MAG: hypothetical protein KatS3mg111_1826 [Pirellulaceae bacterium]|nr:MAG: hypothetical protein KatS3mg111_1826 [Pirellulaceae bacterium]